MPFAFAASINWIAVLRYLSFVQLALTLGEVERKCDAQVLIKKSVKAPFFPIRISGEYSHKNGMRVFVTNKISVERKRSNMLAAAIALHDEFDGASTRIGGFFRVNSLVLRGNPYLAAFAPN